VEEVMSRDVITVEPTTDLKRVGALFQERHIHCLPVVEHGRLVGIITSTDLQRIMKQGVPQHTAYHGSTRPS
jgi:acetoin utilization protein AcuB